MQTPVVTELRRPLQAVTRDTFLVDDRRTINRPFRPEVGRR